MSGRTDWGTERVGRGVAGHDRGAPGPGRVRPARPQQGPVRHDGGAGCRGVLTGVLSVWDGVLQDSIVALQALAEYGRRDPNRDLYDMMVGRGVGAY